MKLKYIIILMVVLLITTSFTLTPPPLEEEEIEEPTEKPKEEINDVLIPRELVQEVVITPEETVSGIIKELQPKITDSEAEKIAKLTIELSSEYDLDPYWMLSMMYVESRFKNDVISSEGARGLMQIMPSTAKLYGVEKEELFNPDTNINTGFQYYRYLLDLYDSQKMATVAYNQGPGNVSRGTYRTWYYGRVREANEKILEIKERVEEIYYENK